MCEVSSFKRLQSGCFNFTRWKIDSVFPEEISDYQQNSVKTVILSILLELHFNDVFKEAAFSRILQLLMIISDYSLLPLFD